MDTHGMKQRRRRLARMSHDTGYSYKALRVQRFIEAACPPFPHHIVFFFFFLLLHHYCFTFRRTGVSAMVSYFYKRYAQSRKV